MRLMAAGGAVFGALAEATTTGKPASAAFCHMRA